MTTRLIPIGRKSAREDPKASRERQEAVVAGWGNNNPDVTLLPMVWENSVSGSSGWRSRGLGLALQRCLDGEADGIIAESQDRLSRQSLVHTAEVWETIQANGLRLVCPNDGLDTATGDHEMLFTIKTAIAREQAKQMAKRTDAMKRSKIADGVYIAGTIPFGYERDPKTKKLVVNESLRAVVEELFARRATGESIASLTRWLNEVVPGGATAKGRWYRTSVINILKNRAYVGEARQGKYVNPTAHDALVSDEVFTVVEALGRRDEAPARWNVSGMLAGVVRCANCGYALTRSKANGYWIYRHRDTAGVKCDNRATISMLKLDEFVPAEVFRRFVDNPDTVIGVESREATEKLARLRGQLETEKKKRVPFEDAEYVALLGLDGAKRALTEINAGVRKLENRIAELSVDVRELPDFHALRAVWDLPEDHPDALSVEEKREILQSVVQHVLVSRAPRAAVADRVRIVWHGEVSPVVAPTRAHGRAEVEVGAAAA
jgi:DNA invertase Pin-like site-specific DNA recombinase